LLVEYCPSIRPNNPKDFGQVLRLLFLDGPCDRIVLLDGEIPSPDVHDRWENFIRQLSQTLDFLGREDGQVGLVCSRTRLVSLDTDKEWLVWALPTEYLFEFHHIIKQGMTLFRIIVED
jgi:hypothetical protein